METLAEVSREVSSILDLDALLVRLAQLTKRLIEYRTFGILLLNPATGELETKLALKYDEKTTPRSVKMGEGWSATRPSTRKSCSCPTSRPTPAT